MGRSYICHYNIEKSGCYSTIQNIKGLRPQSNTMFTTFILSLCWFVSHPSSTNLYNYDIFEHGQEFNLSVPIPTAGNSWVVNYPEENRKVITDQGIRKWQNEQHVIRNYFKTNTTGKINIGLQIPQSYGHSEIRVTLGSKTKTIKISKTDSGQKVVGTFQINTPGYHFLELQGLEKDSDYFPDIDAIWVGGDATAEGVTFVKDDFYWGRRGPSVHLSYEIPKDKDVEWFYNELTVPKGEDVIGSYFMANGFKEGYFGIQVNSESERRILFSVWSPYKTQDPNEIPKDYKIILLGKGKGVTTGEFGNEGSGGQSYRVYDWKAGTTYKFLLKGIPSENNSTDYTAYFYAPEVGKWQLIASFRRPHTRTNLTRLHSFLENFRTETGYMPRKATYGNQWIYDTKGQWHELTKAKFTADATARKGNRLDYAGGAATNTFFMQNCGFFSKNTPIDSAHERTPNENSPTIDFSSLEIPSPD